MIFLSSSTLRPPSRSEVMKPSWPRSPASRRLRSSVSGARSSLGHRVLAGLHEHDVARAAVGGGEADVALALLGGESFDRDHDRRARGEPLGDGGVQQRLGLGVELVLRDLAREQRLTFSEREDRALLLDHAREEVRAQRGIGAGDDEQRARVVPHPEHGESTRPRTETSCWRGGRSGSPALRGRSEDQPPRSLSPILTLRGG